MVIRNTINAHKIINTRKHSVGLVYKKLGWNIYMNVFQYAIIVWLCDLFCLIIYYAIAYNV